MTVDLEQFTVRRLVRIEKLLALSVSPHSVEDCDPPLNEDYDGRMKDGALNLIALRFKLFT